VHNSFKLGLTACALFVAASGAASAADIAKGLYGINAIVTKSSCGTLSPLLKQGATTLTDILYAGTTGKASLVSPGTTSTSKAGSATTQTCLATKATGGTGLNGATVTFSCYQDTASGPASSPLAKIQAKFKVGATHVAQAHSVTVTSNLYVGSSPTPTCAFTTDGTMVLE
jgi:hypothetical protein